MDDNYPTLKRPKKKLIYPITKTCRPNQWAQDIVSLEDVDKMFDDLHSTEEDFPSPSPEIHIPKHKARIVITALPLECQMVANGYHTPASPELDIDSLKAHGPVKTSSPIEENAIEHKNNQSKIDNSASPILFDCEEENQDLEMAETLSEKLQNNNHRKEDDESIFETLPRKSAVVKMSAQEKKTAPVRSKPLTPMRLDAPPEKQTESVQVPTRVKQDMTSFLQKLREAGQPKPARVGLSQAKVMPPVPEPEPEDDFFILEDDAPLYVSLPNKIAKSSKGKQSKTLSSDKETKDTPEEHSKDKLQGIEQDHRNQESQPLTKTSKKKTNATNVPATVESNGTDNPSDGGKTKKKKTQRKTGQSKEDKNPECEGKGTARNDGKPSNKTERNGVKTVEKKGSKQNINVNSQRKRTPAKESRKGANKAYAVADRPEEQSQEVNCENQPGDDSPVSGINNLAAKTSGDMEDVNVKRYIHYDSMEGTSDEGGTVLGKRKRKPTGQWWMSCPQSPLQKQTKKQKTAKTAKHAKKDSSALHASPIKATIGARRKNVKPSSSSSSNSQRQKAEKKKVKKGNQKKVKPFTRTLSEISDEVFRESSQDKALKKYSDSSPLLLSHKDHCISSGEKIFVHQSSASEKLSSTPDHASPTRPEGPLSSKETPKRRRKSPGNWWQVNTTPEDKEVVPFQPQQQRRKATGQKKKRTKKLNARFPSKPLEGAPKQKKRSLAKSSDLCSTVTVSPLVNEKTETKLKKQSNLKPSSTEHTEAAHNVGSMETEECERAQDQSPNQDTMQESGSKVIRSGPSSMIGLQNYEEDDEDIMLPSNTVQLPLCTSDLCAPPLKPLVLQPKDEVNLQDWLKTLWPTTDRGPEITPGDFEWYCYQGRALGLIVDLHSGSICNGKMLLGSFMKKPLWVDHSATTVFNLLTSSVSVLVDCNKSIYSAGQSFMVPPGHAYSIHNLSAQPAVFYFTRVYAGESDE